MIKSVAGIIYINKKYLFQIRDKNPTIWFPGFHGFFGGLIDKKESPAKAIKREILEELNEEILKLNLLFKMNFKTAKLNEERERYYFLLNLKKGFQKKIKINEGAGFKFLSINQLNLNKMIPWDLTAIYYHQMMINNKKFIPK